MKTISALILGSLSLASCQKASDEAASRFSTWRAEATNMRDSNALQSFLQKQNAGSVIPLHQLLRSDTKWRKCGAQPFSVPPKDQWHHIIPTLALIKTEVQPLLGPVEALSVYRSPDINRCIKGASHSFHLRFHAIDMKPAQGIARAEIIQKLCALHAQKGKALNMGLGIYKGTRFHIDTVGYRRWGHDYTASTSPCVSFVAPQRKNR
jgi:uncharacterized protein YcbK (DUF882 family)